MIIESYTVDDLKKYTLSERYLTGDAVPISPERSVSQQQNPRKEQDTPVLFTLSDAERLVAYRTILPDRLYTGESEQPFGWLSGNFVHPAYRRKGHSTRLFKAVEEAWSGRLMYTNYAPASKAVYDRTGVFSEFLFRPGKRYYLRSSMANLLKDRFGNQALLKFADRIINQVADLKQEGRNYNVEIEAEVSEITELNSVAKELIRSGTAGSLFRRTATEFEWIRKYPWTVTDTNSPATGKYGFTWKVDRTADHWYLIETKEGRGFLWINIVDERFSVPYFFQDGPLPGIVARSIVLNKMVEAKASFLTIRDAQLGPMLGTRGNPFLYSKKMGQRYFAHEQLLPMIPENPIIFDGDGDCVFT